MDNKNYPEGFKLQWQKNLPFLLVLFFQACFLIILGFYGFKKFKPGRVKIRANQTAEVTVNVAEEGGVIKPELLGANFFYFVFLFGRDDKKSDRQFLLEKRAETVQKAGLKIIRFPCGCQADLYFWKKPKPTWEGKPGISVAQAVEWARQNGAEISYVVNMQGTFPHLVCGKPIEEYGDHGWRGTLNEMKALVEYANAPNDGRSFWALVRASTRENCPLENEEVKHLCIGRQEPLGIKYFQLSNEPWSSQTKKGNEMSLEEYRQHAFNYGLVAKTYAQEIKRIDSNAQVFVAARTAWSEAKARKWQEGLEESGVLAVVDGVFDHIYNFKTGGLGQSVVFVEVNFKKRLELLKELYPDKKIFFSEWNLGCWENVVHPVLTTTEHALYTANVLRLLAEKNVDLSGFYPLHSVAVDGEGGLLVGHGFKNDNDFFFNAPIFAFSLFKHLVGKRVVVSRVQGPTFDYTGAPEYCNEFQACAPNTNNVPYLYSLAATNEDKSKLWLLLINNHPTQAVDASIEIANLARSLSPEVRGFQLVASSITTRNTSQTPDNITVLPFTATLDWLGLNQFRLKDFSPHSILLLEFVEGELPPQRICALVEPSKLDQSGGKTYTRQQIGWGWGVGNPLQFSPYTWGKLDKVELYVSGSGKIQVKVIEAGGQDLTEIVEQQVRRSGWLSFDFTQEPELKLGRNYVITFRAKWGTIYVHRGNNWAWAYKVYIKPCRGGEIPTQIPVTSPSPTPSWSSPTPSLIPSLTPTPTPTPTSTPSPTPNQDACDQVGPSALNQAHYETYRAQAIGWGWGVGEPLNFTPSQRGKLDKIKLFVSWKKSSKMTVRVVDQAGQTLAEKSINLRNTNSGTWLTFGFDSEPLLQPGSNYIITFRENWGDVYVHRGNYWKWAYQAYLKPCL